MEVAVFSDVSSKQPDLKTLILSALARQPKQGARELHARLLREYAFASSYQGVHKALAQMALKNVLDRRGTKYVVSRDWLVELQDFLGDLDGMCAYNRPQSVLELPNYAALTIKSEGPLIEPYFWILRQAKKIKTSQGALGVACFQHRAWPLPILGGLAFSEFRALFNERDQKAWVGSNKLADQYFAQLWQECGFSVKLGVPSDKAGEWLAAGDFVFQVVHPSATKKRWNAVYDRQFTGGAHGLRVASAMAFETQSPCEVTVTRNPQFASQLRSQVPVCVSARV